MFFSFDGIDGVGKSTQVELFAEFLQSKGHNVVTCRDPGSTSLGEAIREILLRDTATPIDMTSEMLLYMAARAQMVNEVIRPALDAGKTVVSDRFLLSNVAYQGHAGGLAPESIWQVGHIATDGIEPDLYFVLDLALNVAAARMGDELDRIEQRGDDFRMQLRNGFLEEARRRPEKIVVIDADGSVEDVHQRVLEAAKPVLARGVSS
jgi:dTMP kinase